MIVSKTINKREKITFTDLGKHKELKPSDLYNPLGSIEYTVDDIESAISSNNESEMRKISKYFFRRGGIYSNLIRYKMNLVELKYIMSTKTFEKDAESVKETIREGLDWVVSLSLDKTYLEIIKDVLIDGISFRYYVEGKNAITLQELPIDYCRTRFQVDNLAVVEFNPRYFDREFTDVTEREAVLKMYPKDVQKAYSEFKSGTLETDRSGQSWKMLDVDKAVAFTFDGTAVPPFMSVLADIVNLNDQKIMTKRRVSQELSKILIQTIPSDKEGNFILSAEEAKELHNFAKRILEENPDVDVLTTFADTTIEGIQESQKVQQNVIKDAEQGVFTQAGVASSLFNSDSNTTQKSSILKDVASLKYIISSIGTFLNKQLRDAIDEDLWMKLLPVSEHTKKEQYDSYVQGFTYGMPFRMMAAIINGVTQQEFMDLVELENVVLKLNDIMEPAKSSHTQGASDSNEKDEADVTSKTLDNKNAEGGSD